MILRIALIFLDSTVNPFSIDVRISMVFQSYTTYVHRGLLWVFCIYYIYCVKRSGHQDLIPGTLNDFLGVFAHAETMIY